MAENTYMNKNDKPDDRMLSETLGRSYALWQSIKNPLTDSYGPLVEEWKFYGGKCGWNMKFLHKKRNLFFLTCLGRTFRIGFVFGNKAVEAVLKSDLPDNLKEELKNAKKYAEGKGLRIEVKNAKDVSCVVALARIKIEN